MSDTDAAPNSRDREVLVIERAELQRKLERHDDFKLINSLGEWQFTQSRIPGSIHFNTYEDILRELRQDEEIVVYCTNIDCKASIKAYHFLVNHGYSRVRRYAGGLIDWEDAGLPLEGARNTGNAPASMKSK